MSSVTILSTADFNSAVWTNKQHLAAGLAKSHDVLFIESLGLRRPTLSRADVRRLTMRMSRPRSRIARDRQTTGTDNTSLTIMRPNVIPFHSSAFVREVNLYTFNRQLRKYGMTPGSARVLWTFSPVIYELARFHGPIVYHAVDLLHTFERVDGDMILEQERDLLRVADLVIASSKGVQSHLHSQGRPDVILWENVADTQLYTSEAYMQKGERNRRAIFAGNLSSSKVDFRLILAVADSGLDVTLAGPIGIDGTAGVDRELQRSVFEHPRVTYVGSLKPEDLAREVARSQVGIIPYVLSEHTVGIFPMKVFEYLAAGLPVVSTKLRSLNDYDQVIRLVDYDEFASAAEIEADRFSEAAASRRISIAAAHSWESRVRDASAVVGGFEQDEALQR